MIKLINIEKIHIHSITYTRRNTCAQHKLKEAKIQLIPKINWKTNITPKIKRQQQTKFKNWIDCEGTRLLLFFGFYFVFWLSFFLSFDLSLFLFHIYWDRLNFMSLFRNLDKCIHYSKALMIDSGEVPNY